MPALHPPSQPPEHINTHTRHTTAGGCVPRRRRWLWRGRRAAMAGWWRTSALVSRRATVFAAAASAVVVVIDWLGGWLVGLGDGSKQTEPLIPPHKPPCYQKTNTHQKPSPALTNPSLTPPLPPIRNHRRGRALGPGPRPPAPRRAGGRGGPPGRLRGGVAGQDRAGLRFGGAFFWGGCVVFLRLFIGRRRKGCCCCVWWWCFLCVFFWGGGGGRGGVAGQ